MVVAVICYKSFKFFVLAVAVLLEADISLFNLLTAAPLREAKVSREKVIEVAEEICMIVHNEFIFIPVSATIFFYKFSKILIL